MDRGAWQATAHGVARSQRQLSDFHGDNDDDLCMISNFRGLPSAFACIICSELSWQSDAEPTEKQRRMRKTGQEIIKIDCCCGSDCLHLHRLQHARLPCPESAQIHVH